MRGGEVGWRQISRPLSSSPIAAIPFPPPYSCTNRAEGGEKGPREETQIRLLFLGFSLLSLSMGRGGEFFHADKRSLRLCVCVCERHGARDWACLPLPLFSVCRP